MSFWGQQKSIYPHYWAHPFNSNFLWRNIKKPSISFQQYAENISTFSFVPVSIKTVTNRLFAEQKYQMADLFYSVRTCLPIK
jgi:hypothetical protein